MLHSRFLFLLLGLAAGILVGLALQRGEPARRSEARPAPAPVREAPSRTDEAPGGESENSAVLSGETQPSGTALAPADDGSLPVDAFPSESRAPDEALPAGQGRVVLEYESEDAAATHSTWVHVLDLGGNREELELTSEGSCAWADLVAGDYTIWIEEESSPALRAVRVRVAAGQVTRIWLDDPALPERYPIPEGLGRLDVLVLDTAGNPLPRHYATLHGLTSLGADDRSAYATDQGTLRFQVIPGECTLELGPRRVPVRIREGQTTAVTVRHEKEGELLVEGPFGGTHVVRSAESGEWLQPQVAEHAETEPISRFTFLPPGVYEIGYLNGERIAGRVEVLARRVARFRFVAPTGSIRLRIEFDLERDGDSNRKPHAVLHAKVEVIRVEDGARIGETDYSYHVSTLPPVLHYPIAALEPGTYRVRIEAKGHEPWEQTVAVGSSRVDVTARLVPRAP